MQGLLHSKKFKANLYKWLFMYIGVMLLFTTIVTYSKYMSSTTSNTSGIRTAKFAVEVTSLDSTCNGSNECDNGEYRYTTPLTYTFKVDTSNLEVKTSFVLGIAVHPDFKVLKFVRIGSPNTNLVSFIDSNNKATFNNTINPTEGTIDTYEIEVIYNKDVDGTVDFSTRNASNNKVVEVSYTATQLQ